jgi:hypothetical protein
VPDRLGTRTVVFCDAFRGREHCPANLAVNVEPGDLSRATLLAAEQGWRHDNDSGGDKRPGRPSSQSR